MDAFDLNVKMAMSSSFAREKRGHQSDKTEGEELQVCRQARSFFVDDGFHSIFLILACLFCSIKLIRA